MKITYAAISETGLRAGENQDSIFCASHEGGGVFLVADGMGGHTNGRMASRLVREETRLAWERNAGNSSLRSHPYLMDASLREALHKANKRIRLGTEEKDLSGSTAVILRVGGDGYGVVNCGDSRCYSMKHSLTGLRLKQITEDEVMKNGKEESGKLLRAVGTEVSFRCNTLNGSIRKKTLFILCSDGIYKYLEKNDFEQMLKEAYREAGSGEILLRQADRIRDSVYENGAPDNLSLILILADPGR